MKFKKKKITILLIIIIFFAILLSNIDIIINSLSQNSLAKNSYKDLRDKILKISSFYDKKYEKILLRLNKKHQNHWTIEKANNRIDLEKFKYISPEKNPTLSKKDSFDVNQNWYRSHSNHSSNRFSELTLINKKNIKNLKISWIYNSGEPQDIQCNPIVIDGIIYTPISGNYIAAINGYDGKIIWKSNKFKSSLAKRGLIYWKNKKTGDERIFFSNQKNLISLNAKDGSYDKKFGSNGIVRTGLNLVPPAIYNNQIIIPTLDRYIEVYNLINGKLEWKFKFREKIKKRIGGVKYNNSGGTPWSGSSLDEERGIFYLSTGNPGYFFDGTRRPGPNKDANSIIAIDLNKKEKLWSFQETIHDIWNLDIASPPILTSIYKDMKYIDVVVAPTKTGNTLILDRMSGKPIFEYRLEKVEASSIPGERTSIYQPNITMPEPFERIFFQKKDIRKKFQKKFSNKNYEYGRYKPVKFDKIYVRGGIVGGAQWVGASVDPKKAIMYVTSNNIAYGTQIEKLKDTDKFEAPVYKSKYSRLLENNKYPINEPPWGTLNAINLNTGKLLWKVPLGNYEEFNIDNNLTGTENFGGTTVTRGGIAITSGTLDKKIYFHDIENGNLLKSIKLPYIGSAPPTTYIAKDEQFIIIHSTGGASLSGGYGKLVETGDALVGLKIMN